MTQSKQDKTKIGIWLIDAENLALTWAGEPPAPRPTVKERMLFARLYIKSKGKGPRLLDIIKRLAKAIAFCLNASQVSASGNPYDTVSLRGSSIEEAWNNFNLTACGRPHSGH